MCPYNTREWQWHHDGRTFIPSGDWPTDQVDWCILSGLSDGSAIIELSQREHGKDTSKVMINFDKEIHMLNWINRIQQAIQHQSDNCGGWKEDE